MRAFPNSVCLECDSWGSLRNFKWIPGCVVNSPMIHDAESSSCLQVLNAKGGKDGTFWKYPRGYQQTPAFHTSLSALPVSLESGCSMKTLYCCESMGYALLPHHPQLCFNFFWFICCACLSKHSRSRTLCLLKGMHKPVNLGVSFCLRSLDFPHISGLKKIWIQLLIGFMS